MSDHSKKTASLVEVRPGLDPRLPPHYSPELHKKIVQNIRNGNLPVTAAVAAGLPRSEFNHWRIAVANGTAHPAVLKLFEDMDQAFALAEADAVTNITTDDSKPAENAKWFLEHSRAENWGKRETLVVRNELDAALDRLQSALTEAEFEKVLGILSGGGS